MRDVALPSRESDRAMVLPARPMLREQSEPMFPIGGEVDHPCIAPTAHPSYPARCEGANGVASFTHDPLVTAVEREDQLPGPGVAADPTIPEVEAEEVCIRLRRLARADLSQLASCECTVGFAKPVQESGSGDSGLPRDCVGTEAISVECQDPFDMYDGMHEQMFASAPEGLASGRPGWRNTVRRSRLKPDCPQGRVGSNPTPGTQGVVNHTGPGVHPTKAPGPWRRTGRDRLHCVQVRSLARQRAFLGALREVARDGH